jgi:hypothetical protein
MIEYMLATMIGLLLGWLIWGRPADRRYDALLGSIAEEREQLVRHLVQMKRLGFVEMAEGDEGGDEPWVIDNEMELKVYRERSSEREQTLQKEADQ